MKGHSPVIRFRANIKVMTTFKFRNINYTLVVHTYLLQNVPRARYDCSEEYVLFFKLVNDYCFYFVP